MANITDLPNELLEQIVLDARHFTVADEQPPRIVLFNLSLTCRALYRVVFRYIHENRGLVEEKCGKRKLVDYLECIRRNPDMADAVQYLDIHLWDYRLYVSGISSEISFARSYKFLKGVLDNEKLPNDITKEALARYPSSLLLTVILFLHRNLMWLGLKLEPLPTASPSGTAWLAYAMDLVQFPFSKSLWHLELVYSPTMNHGEIVASSTSTKYPCNSTIAAFLKLSNLTDISCSEEEPETTFDPLLTDDSDLTQDLQSLLVSEEERLQVESEFKEHYNRFRTFFHPLSNALKDIAGECVLTEISLHDCPLTTWPNIDIIHASKGLEEFTGFVGNTTRETPTDVVTLNNALMVHQKTLKNLALSYSKGYRHRDLPSFTLNFAKYLAMEELWVTASLLTNVEADEIYIGEILPPSLETLNLKIRFPGPWHRPGLGWDYIVATFAKHVSERAGGRLKNFKNLEVNMINFMVLNKEIVSEYLNEAKAVTSAKGINFSVSTWDPSKGRINLC